MNPKDVSGLNKDFFLRSCCVANQRWKRLLTFFVILNLFAVAPVFGAIFTVTECADPGTGSLREAMTNANASAGADTIDFNITIDGSCPAPLNIQLSSNLPAITEGLTISGPGAGALSISGWQAFTISGAITVEISGLTIKNSQNFAGGGAARNQGGDLTLRDMTITGNLTSGSSPGPGAIYNGSGSTLTIENSIISGSEGNSGGGIYNEGTAVITDSEISGNTARYQGGAISNQSSGMLTIENSVLSGNEGRWGGGVYTDGILVITNSDVSDNTAPGNLGGGGLMIYTGGSLTMTGSIVSGNAAFNLPAGGSGNGGGIQVDMGATASITNSTISLNTLAGNTGGGGGAGIFNWGTMTIVASTISGNALIHEGICTSMGGGIFHRGGFGNTMTITNSTISGNSGGTTCQYGGGGIFTSGGLVVNNSTINGNTGRDTGDALDLIGNGITGYGSNNKVKNTILANNTFRNCIPGVIASLGHNLSDDTSCATDIPLGDLNNVDAGLDPGGLQDNGGLTKTIALLPDSLALNAIPPANCTAVDTTQVSTDQRGFVRPQDDNCDIGAYEALYIPCVTCTVTPSVTGIGGSIAPDTPQDVTSGETTSFTLRPDNGFIIGSVGGTCGGAVDGNRYTTNAIIRDCTVEAGFVKGDEIFSNGFEEPPRLVFISSAGYTGGLGGLDGADLKCNTLATAAGLPGTYAAWLSTRNTAVKAKDRIGDHTWVRIDGAVVADNLADLTDGTIQNPINIDESGATTTFTDVWTGTGGNGQFEGAAAETCWAGGPGALLGNPAATTASDWTDGKNWLSFCSHEAPIYCFGL